MYKEAAEKFAIEVEKELGSNYRFEDLLKLQMKVGILSSKGMNAYNLRNEFLERKDAQTDMPKNERKSNRGITDSMASENNCSLSYMYNVVRECY